MGALGRLRYRARSDRALGGHPAARRGDPGEADLQSGQVLLGSLGYRGPSPPPGKPHRYFFKLYALDAPVNLPPEATKDELLSAARGHIITETHVMAKYGRDKD